MVHFEMGTTKGFWSKTKCKEKEREKIRLDGEGSNVNNKHLRGKNNATHIRFTKGGNGGYSVKIGCTEKGENWGVNGKGGKKGRR